MARVSKAERDLAIAELRKILKPGDTVWTSVKHVSSSGMSRSINLYVLKARKRVLRDDELHESFRDKKHPRFTKLECEPLWISHLVHKATGHGWDDKREAVRIGGCGMDMGFALVYDLASVLYPKQDAQGNPDTHGIGYALNQRWL